MATEGGFEPPMGKLTVYCLTSLATLYHEFPRDNLHIIKYIFQLLLKFFQTIYLSP